MNEERKFLEHMARIKGGLLKIDDVLEAAQDKSCILHKHFEWDDSKAADQFRREQARTLIQRCRITLVEQEPVKVRAFVSLPSDRETGGGYRLTSTVITDEIMKEELLRDIKLTIARWTQKAHLLDSNIADLLLLVQDAVSVEDSNENEARAA